MPEPQPDPERENRIHDEIIVDTYDSEERAMGWWYYYVSEKCQFPFHARCIAERAISPLIQNCNENNTK